MTPSLFLPHMFADRHSSSILAEVNPAQSGSANLLTRVPVRVDLADEYPDVDLLYVDAQGNITRRRIKPVALTVLAGGEIALVGHCHLRDAERNFAFARMRDIHMSTRPQQLITNKELLHFFREAFLHLVAHDSNLNGIPHTLINESQSLQSRTDWLPDDIPRVAQAVRDKFLTLVDRITRLADILQCDTHGIAVPIAITTSISLQSRNSDVQIDLPSDIATHIISGSSHLRLSILSAQAAIRTSGTDLRTLVNAQASISHQAPSLHVLFQRECRTSASGGLLALNSKWSSSNPESFHSLADWLIDRIATTRTHDDSQSTRAQREHATATHV